MTLALAIDDPYAAALGGDQDFAGMGCVVPGASYNDPEAFQCQPASFAGGAVTVTHGNLFNPMPAGTEGTGAGFRLLGAPVAGLTPTSLASLNLVQGIAAGTNAATHRAQYPLAGANLFTGYTGLGYTRPDADDALAPGRGFFWYLYDRTIAAASVPASFGGGTSSSRELTGFQLLATGTEATANVSVAFADNVGVGTNDFQMLANPFARPLAVSGITVTGGTIQGGDVFRAYNPNGNSFVVLTGAARLAVWQGVFAELVPTAAGGAVTVNYAFASTDTGTAPTFYGKTDGDLAEAPSVRLTLDGTLASGAHVADDAALVRLAGGAAAGWDALDASKSTPPGASYALVAPVIERDGARYALGVDSRPPGAPATIPVALTTTGAGTFTLTWTAALPQGWTATLADTQTGESRDLTTATDYAFTTRAAVAGAERFVLTLRPAGATAGGDAPALVLGLSQPAPNPASRRSSLVLTVPTPERVRAVVIDALGREVAVLVDGEVSGAMPLTVEMADLAAGVYTVRATSATFVLARRLTVVR